MQKFCLIPTHKKSALFVQRCIHVLCMVLVMNSEYFPVQDQLIGFCNRDGVCLLHGTDCVFMYISRLTLHRGRFFSEYFCFSLAISFHQCSIPIYIYTLLSPGHMGEAWEPSKKQYSFGYRRTLDKKVFSLSVPWLRRLVPGFSPWRPDFDCRADQVRFVVDKVALRDLFVRVRPFFPVRIVPSLLHRRLHLLVVLTNTNLRSLIKSSFRSREHWVQKYFHFVFEGLYTEFSVVGRVINFQLP
jgi:hypothetical protein